MIFVDVTRTGSARQRSGLTRVTQRLLDEWGGAAQAVEYRNGVWQRGGRPLSFRQDDWLFTAELFSRDERPGFAEMLRLLPARTAALFHDAIPLRRPDITWPKSVARHPDYMKLLAGFSRVFAVSRSSRDELEGYWRWLGLRDIPPVEAISLGADLPATPRTVVSTGSPQPLFLSVGILEPRKNQALLLDVAETLWLDGLDFELHLVGRVNPHFGAPLVDRIKLLRRQGFALFHHSQLDDAGLRELYGRTSALLFPTVAEGCGLPLLEALWQGTPCLCSDLPVLRENADEGGCLPLPVNHRAAWRDALRKALLDPEFLDRLRRQAVGRPLPTWAETAARIQKVLTSA